MADSERLPPGALGVFTTDAALRVRTWDEWLVRATGTSLEAARGRPLVALVPDLESRGLLAAFERVLAGGGVEILAPAFHKYLLPCPPIGGSAVFERMQQRVTIGPLRDGAAVVGTVVAIEDVTARIEHERALATSLASADPDASPLAWQGAAGHEPIDHAPFVETIGNDDWRRRRAAVATLRGNTVAVIAAALRALRDDHRNFSVLSSVVELLVETDVDVVDSLLALLAHPEPDLRLQAALLLGERGDARAIPALLDALNDPDENLRFHVIEALGKLKAVGAVDALAGFAESREFFLAFPALEALAQIGDSSVAPRLAPLMNDELLRSAVADALGRIGDEDVVAPLAELLNASAAPTGVVADALANIYDRYDQRYHDGDLIAQLVRKAISTVGTQNLLEALDATDTAQLRSIARLLGWLEGGAVDLALTRLLGEPSVRSKVVEYLVRHGEGVVDLLIDQLAAEDRDTRQAAVVALGRIGDRRATKPILGLLVDEAGLAVAAAGALARLGDRAAFEPLLSHIDHPESAVRQAVIGALNSIGHPDMAARIGPLLGDPRPHIRESAVRIAGYFGYPECADRLLRCAADEDALVQRAAIEHLPFLDDARVTPILIGLMGHPNATLRAAAVQALARVDDPLAGPHLMGALSDPDSWVRYFGARALGERRDAAGIARLSWLACDDASGHVRLAAIDALGAIGSPLAIPALAALCASEEREHAVAAIRALGGIDHPSGWPPLQGAIRSTDEDRRIAAAGAMASVGTPGAVAALEWVAGADQSDVVATAAIRGLSLLTARGPVAELAVTALVGLAVDAKRRELVITGMSAIPPPLFGIMGAGLQDIRPGVRVAIVQALGRTRHGDAAPWLERALDDRAIDVRLAALAEVRYLGTRTMERKLVTLAHADPDVSVRRAALTALGSARSTFMGNSPGGNPSQTRSGG